MRLSNSPVLLYSSSPANSARLSNGVSDYEDSCSAIFFFGKPDLSMSAGMRVAGLMKDKMKGCGNGFSFWIFVEIEQWAADYSSNRTSCFPEWILQNQTLVTGFGGVGLVIGDAHHNQRDIRKELETFKNEFYTFRTYVVDELTQLHRKNQITQAPVMKSAVNTIDGVELRQRKGNVVCRR